jgi:addiction module RelE/StbE family toxin
MRVRWTEAAVRDLEELHAFIAADRPQAADRTVDSILNALETAARFPESGRTGARVKGTRELVLAPWLIVYRVRAGAIEVLSVIHGSRRWPERREQE